MIFLYSRQGCGALSRPRQPLPYALTRNGLQALKAPVLLAFGPFPPSPGTPSLASGIIYTESPLAPRPQSAPAIARPAATPSTPFPAACAARSQTRPPCSADPRSAPQFECPSTLAARSLSIEPTLRLCNLISLPSRLHARTGKNTGIPTLPTLSSHSLKILGLL